MAAKDDWVAKAASGRTITEQMRDIEVCGNHGALPVLRAMTLAANGVPRARERAEVGLLFGCYRPFSTPYIVRDTVRLFELLGIDYTWLEKEYCCGLPLLHQVEGQEREAVAGSIRENMRRNREMALAKGADRLAYCCAGCAHAAKSMLEEEQARHSYILDLLLDRLEGRPLRVKPLRVAYFEGCHTSYAKPLPQVALDWGRYRRFLDGVAALEVVDLPPAMCCKVMADKIIDRAADQGVDALVCACSGCNVAMRQAGQGRLRVMGYPELLLESLGEETGGKPC